MALFKTLSFFELSGIIMVLWFILFGRFCKKGKRNNMDFSYQFIFSLDKSAGRSVMLVVVGN